MIITRRFVFIHYPETAGMWTSKVIKQIHADLFIKKTPLGETLLFIGKWLPFLKSPIQRMIRRLVELNYTDYDISGLTLRNYHSPFYKYNWIRRILEWLIIIAEAMFLLDKNYETLLVMRRHTRYAQIPEYFQKLPLVSNIRNPFSWHISRYLYYQNWQTQQGRQESQEFIKLWGDIKDFDHYCSEKMMSMQNAFYQGYKNYLALNGTQTSMHEQTREPIQYHDDFISFYKPGDDKHTPTNHYGLMTLRFIQMYFKCPWRIMDLSPKDFDEYWSSGSYKQDMPKITFLEQENIAKEIFDYMLKMRYPEEALSSCKSIPPQNLSQTQSSPDLLQEHYSSKKLIELIYKLEKPIFTVFPQYNKIYRELIADK